nr:immunoglobulin light chain junction region [Macaca mulatta]MOX69364.1 immunoglobulin light chain junction region [Macaca mulatta]MOX69387.1 immunoglobulin light chain junction region [Macaca mulatta]MOX69536.1 immunoglobulin light chain junction region [Macaca mulatta]MOX69591.1 immunoglobulin light chain junction region [Macaca mulatta]
DYFCSVGDSSLSSVLF